VRNGVRSADRAEKTLRRSTLPVGSLLAQWLSCPVRVFRKGGKEIIVMNRIPFAAAPRRISVAAIFPVLLLSSFPLASCSSGATNEAGSSADDSRARESVATAQAALLDDACQNQCVADCPTGTLKKDCVASCRGECTCQPSCAGKACGASNGCGGRCLSACPPSSLTYPNNGTVFDGTVAGTPRTFVGYAGAPAQYVSLEIFNWAQQNWSTVSATSDTAPDFLFANDPIFAWSAQATPAYWTQGGLLRVHTSALSTFDETRGSSCWASSTANNYKQLVTDCQSPYGPRDALIVSSNPTPAATSNLQFRRYLRSGAPVTATETQSYYNTIGAGPGGPLSTLAGFKSQYGFGTAGGDEVTALYYNQADLGLGRLMTCRSFPILVSYELVGKRFAPVYADAGHACYVTNFGKDTGGIARFGADALDPETALSQAIAGTDPIATVAMVYEPCSRLSPCLIGSRSVKFIVYAGANDPDGIALGNTRLTAPLDDHGAANGSNVSIPNNCLACHGAGSASYDSAQHNVAGKPQFLPFDLFSFRYSADPGLTQTDQLEKFRALNLHVYNTDPSPAIKDLLVGMYSSTSGPVAGTVANDAYVPEGWQVITDPTPERIRAAKQIYAEVVKPYCRTCHISRTAPANDWLSYENFVAFKSTIDTRVCGFTHDMPNAVETQKNFWRSPARAHLVAGLGLTDTDCPPE
jgi:hypothetical protein